MNNMIAAIGVDPGFAAGRGGVRETAAVAAFAVAGLILLIAAWRLCTRKHRDAHAARYTSPRR